MLFRIPKLKLLQNQVNDILDTEFCLPRLNDEVGPVPARTSLSPARAGTDGGWRTV